LTLSIVPMGPLRAMLRIRTQIRIICQDPDPFPGFLGSGSISYTNEHNKINWKEEFIKEYFLWGSCWTY
jgi:hypothetical protein